VRAAAERAVRQVLVSMDLPGPKLRTGPIVDGPMVGRARVTRNESGQVLAPARIWLTQPDAPTQPPRQPTPAARPTLAVQVDRDWLTVRNLGDVVTLRDARGRKRTFTVTEVGHDGVPPGQRDPHAHLRCLSVDEAGVAGGKEQEPGGAHRVLVLGDDAAVPGLQPAHDVVRQLRLVPTIVPQDDRRTETDACLRFMGVRRR